MSTFFASALTLKIEDGSDQYIDLPTSDPDVFDEFLAWLYSETGSLNQRSDEDSAEYYHRLCSLCKLANSHGVKPLMTCITTAM